MKHHVSLYAGEENRTQIVERTFDDLSKAFDEAQRLLEQTESDPRIDEGEYCSVEVDHHVGN